MCILRMSYLNQYFRWIVLILFVYNLAQRSVLIARRVLLFNRGQHVVIQKGILPLITLSWFSQKSFFSKKYLQKYFCVRISENKTIIIVTKSLNLQKSVGRKFFTFNGVFNNRFSSHKRDAYTVVQLFLSLPTAQNRCSALITYKHTHVCGLIAEEWQQINRQVICGDFYPET